MKRIVILIILTIFGVNAQAQRNIKWFEGKTPEQIMAEYGVPEEVDLSGVESSDYMVDFAIYYNHFYIYLNRQANSVRNGSIVTFATDSPEFIALTDIVPGGIHVGGRVRDLRIINFGNTPDGHNNSANNLKVAELECGFGEYPEHYRIYSEESVWIGIDAQNGIIKSWGLFSNDDIPPYNINNAGRR